MLMVKVVALLNMAWCQLLKIFFYSFPEFGFLIKELLVMCLGICQEGYWLLVNVGNRREVSPVCGGVCVCL